MLYKPKNISYIESGIQRPIGMTNRLERINRPLGRKINDLIGILLFSALIGSCVSESVKLADKTIEYYQTRPKSEIQESARKYLDYIQNN